MINKSFYSIFFSIIYSHRLFKYCNYFKKNGVNWLIFLLEKMVNQFTKN